MTIAFWCILAAIVLPYATVAIGKVHRRYNNRTPREWEEKLEGARKRAIHAHLNHFEALPAFAAAVIVAHLQKAPQSTVDVIALTFIALRVAYTAAYLADRPATRSLIWLAGFACVIALFVVAAGGAR
jgi:uncharacterized MAPEG superfamily protein